jgi:hypothetical protein
MKRAGGVAPMTTIMPEGEALRRAVKYISDELQENPSAAPGKLIEQAVLRFDLSPKDADFLTEFYRKGKGKTESVS